MESWSAWVWFVKEFGGKGKIFIQKIIARK